MTRKKTRTNITDVSSDILRHIMIHVARSLNGPANLASTLAVCRVFREFGEDEGILKAVDFRDVKLPVNHKSFWQLSGLAVKCLCAGNRTVIDVLEEYKEDICSPARAKLGEINVLMQDLTLKEMALKSRYTRFRGNAVELSWKKYVECRDAFDVHNGKVSDLLQVLQYVECHSKKRE